MWSDSICILILKSKLIGLCGDWISLIIINIFAFMPLGSNACLSILRLRILSGGKS